MSPVPLPGFARLPATLSGRWSSPAREVWTGRIACAQTVVGVTLHVCDGVAHWSKSVRLRPDTDAVRLGLGIHPDDPAYVTIGSNAFAQPARLAQAGARPELADEQAIETGVRWELCRFDSTPAIAIVLLFLATTNIRFGRNQLWRVRPELAETPEPFRTILAGGRSGVMAWPQR